MKRIIVFFVLALIVFAPLAAFAEGMPDWYPEDVNSWTFTPAGDDAKRVIDDADIFTDEEEELLEAKIKKARASCGADIVVFTDWSTHGLEVPVYAADFYEFNGYGVGEEHEGFCLFLLMEQFDRQGWCCATGTRARSVYTEANANVLDDRLYEYLGNKEFVEGVSNWVGNIEKLYRTGRVPTPPAVWVFRIIAAAVVALIVSSIVVGSAKRKMQTVRLAYNANDHLIDESFGFANVEDTFINSDVTRTYSPVSKNTGSGGRGGSGGSSHSSGYHSSSGSSHSGSGRHF